MKLVKNETIIHQQKQTTTESSKNPHSIGLSAFDIASRRIEARQRKFKTAGLA